MTKCACIRSDAYDCAHGRYKGGPAPVDLEPCDCACHESDFDMDDMMAMPEAELERMADTEMRKYEEHLARMTDAQRIANSRRLTLSTCRGYRRTLRVLDIEHIRECLLRCQRRLVMLREWRRTGIEPGTSELH